MNKLHRPFQAIIILFLVVGMVVPTVNSVSIAEPRMHPLLAEMVAADSEQLVRVIVQKSGDTNRAEAVATRLGAVIYRDLEIINAFAAEMPVWAAERLSTDDQVTWVSIDAPVASAGKPDNDPCPGCPPNTYLESLGVQAAWDMGYDGEGIAVAVVDSGIATDRDFSTEPGKPFSRIVKQVSFSTDSHVTADEYGHGTHVAGIVGGHGGESGGLYAGVAPGVDLINLKISNESGMAYESDTVDALQWALDYKDQYNIRVLNLSVNSTVEQTFHTSPLAAAAEILWFNGIVVIAAAGNSGEDAGYDAINAAPANDPFVITVGASLENGTADRADDTVASFSASGITLDGFAKPDIIAPGKDIISVLASSSDWYYDYPARAVHGKEYFRISGTSMSAPMVTGAVALLLQAEPNLTPDQVKYRLMDTGTLIEGFPYLDVEAALTTPTSESANQGVVPHMLLAKMALIAYWANQNGEENIDWENVDWASVNWNSVNWNSVNWNAVNWNSVNWNSVNWNAVNWNAVNWNAVNWNSVNWNSVNWNSVNWNSVNWNSVNWNSVNWSD